MLCTHWSANTSNSEASDGSACYDLREGELRMVTSSTVAEIGAVLGDPARVNMLIALLDGRARTARELADAASVTPQTASSHLARLTDAQFVTVEQHGRHRYHRLASSEIAALIESIHVVGATLSSRRSGRPGPADPRMRALRSCYDHMAGRIAVKLSEALLSSDNDNQLSEWGQSKLENIGIDLQRLKKGGRPFFRACRTWSERRTHLAGQLALPYSQDPWNSTGSVRIRRTGSSVSPQPEGMACKKFST